MSDENVARRVAAEQVVAAPEAMRARSRSFASLVATGVGGLLAGVVFSTFGDRLWGFGLGFAIVGLVLLLVGLALLVSASIYFQPRSQRPASRWARIALWLSGEGSSSEPDLEKITLSDLVATAQDLNRGIARRTRIGTIFAAVGAVAAVTAVMLAWTLPQQIEVRVDVGSWSTGACPDLPSGFDALVERVVLRSDSELVAVTIEGQQCSPFEADQIVLYIPRAIAIFRA